APQDIRVGEVAAGDGGEHGEIARLTDLAAALEHLLGRVEIAPADVDRVIRITEAFIVLGDRDVAERCLDLAGTMADTPVARMQGGASGSAGLRRMRREM